MDPRSPFGSDLHERLGDYVLLRELARGASAVVYHGEDTRDGRAVAIKVADFEDRFDAPEVARFRVLFANEGSLAGRLVHPNIARMYEAVLDQTPQYLVMEYVPGVPLRQHTHPDTLLPRRQVLGILFRCARAIDYVHGCEVLHRDLKPGNVLLTPSGDVKVIDFGAAQIGWAQRTQLGGFLGSPAYMAPEQLLERAPSRATDVYALGVMLFELLAGRHPFQDNADTGAGVIQRILHEPPASLAGLAPDLPPAVLQLVARAMARDPADRYPDCFSLARDLLTCMQ